MARLGASGNPLMLTVNNEKSAKAAVTLCLENNWKFTLRMTKDEPENLTDLQKKLAPEQESLRFDQPKIGRNAPCPCGSGKKFKKCCASSLH